MNPCSRSWRPVGGGGESRHDSGRGPEMGSARMRRQATCCCCSRGSDVHRPVIGRGESRHDSGPPMHFLSGVDKLVPETFARTVRSHWGCKPLHWTPDVVIHDDPAECDHWTRKQGAYQAHRAHPPHGGTAPPLVRCCRRWIGGRSRGSASRLGAMSCTSIFCRIPGFVAALQPGISPSDKTEVLTRCLIKAPRGVSLAAPMVGR